MAVDTKPKTIREAVGVFVEAETLQRAIEELRGARFSSEEIGLVARDASVKAKLSHIFAEAAKVSDHPDAPRTAFVVKDTLGEHARTMFGGTLSIAAVAAGGAIVVSAGVLGGAIAAAAAGVAAVGGLGAILAGFIDQSDAEYLENELDEGHLLLFVRTRDAEREARAKAILASHSPHDVRIYSVPAPDPA